MLSRCSVEFMKAFWIWLSLCPSPMFSPIEVQQQTSEPSEELWYRLWLRAIEAACCCATEVRSEATLRPDTPWLARALFVSDTNAPAELAYAGEPPAARKAEVASAQTLAATVRRTVGRLA